MSETTKKWTPPRGAVTVTPDFRRPTSFCTDCATCGYHYPSPGFSSTRTDADDQKRYHRCPAGTVGAFPTCPVCRSTGKACKNPSGNPQSEWHSPRAQIWAEEIGDQP